MDPFRVLIVSLMAVSAVTANDDNGEIEFVYPDDDRLRKIESRLSKEDNTINMTALFNDEGSFIGQDCFQKNGTIGECRLVQDCPTAQSDLRKVRKNHFNRCGFSGRIEIICCPDITGIQEPGDQEEVFVFDEIGNEKPVNVGSRVSPTERKSYKVCKELEKEAPIDLEPHILGGETAKEYEFPHMAALGYNKDTSLEFDCGGALISDRYVLTAAHCIINKEGIKPSKIRLGVNSLSKAKAEEDFNVERDIIHPLYNRSVKYNDIALLRLDREVKFNYRIYPACLHTDPKDLSGILIITGWGNTNVKRAQKSDNLLKANVTWVSIENCNTSYAKTGKRNLPNGIVGQQMCAVDETGNQDSCQGDSGGPIQIPGVVEGLFTVVGVTSFGMSCGIGVPGVYTKVSSYLDWIESIVWPN